MGETFFKTAYHHHFTLYYSSAEIEFSDILEIHTLELRKLPKITDGTILYGWAKFNAAETEKELEFTVTGLLQEGANELIAEKQ